MDRPEWLKWGLKLLGNPQINWTDELINLVKEVEKKEKGENFFYVSGGLAHLKNKITDWQQALQIALEAAKEGKGKDFEYVCFGLFLIKNKITDWQQTLQIALKLAKEGKGENFRQACLGLSKIENKITEWQQALQIALEAAKEGKGEDFYNACEGLSWIKDKITDWQQALQIALEAAKEGKGKDFQHTLKELSSIHNKNINKIIKSLNDVEKKVDFLIMFLALYNHLTQIEKKIKDEDIDDLIDDTKTIVKDYSKYIKSIEEIKETINTGISHFPRVSINPATVLLNMFKGRDLWEIILNKKIGDYERKIINTLKKHHHFIEPIGQGSKWTYADLLVNAYHEGKGWRKKFYKEYGGEMRKKMIKIMGNGFAKNWDNPSYKFKQVNIKGEEIKKISPKQADKEIMDTIKNLHISVTISNKEIFYKDLKNKLLKKSKLNKDEMNELINSKEGLIIKNVEINGESGNKVSIGKDKIIIQLCQKLTKKLILEEGLTITVEGSGINLKGYNLREAKNLDDKRKILNMLISSEVFTEKERVKISSLLGSLPNVVSPGIYQDKIWERNPLKDLSSFDEFGCCAFIGGPNDWGAPIYLWDPRLVFMDTYKGDERRYRTYMFACKDKILLIDSIEGQHDPSQSVAKLIINDIKKYAKDCGFEKVAFNTKVHNHVPQFFCYKIKEEEDRKYYGLRIEPILKLKIKDAEDAKIYLETKLDSSKNNIVIIPPQPSQ